ncbi:hypothetical protein EDD29_5550 [Actinocorallia herbida]|uniref:Uncharacterized protein n=1 Tax=Actinocorallia herbida TaxID=58109 RepID=A0A3N1D301_9ACTN|nr:hypothetical protein [Actinocorallia herbida]ROO87902.1 hypothetical protein EDD29_5550 [Actinocorallia herbida]
MSDHDDNSLHEKPLEFLQSIGNTGGWCDGQAIIPSADGTHYDCWCSCGEWSVQAPTTEEGLHAARIHTGSVSA